MNISIEKQILFAEMINTRFCHDMAGPVSAVNNGLEFFEGETDPEVREQAMDLLRLSAKESFTKLQFYRIAFGRAAHATESNVDEVKEIVFRYFEHDKINLDWPEAPADGFAPKLNNEVRQVLVNMILLVASQLVFGGTLSVRKIIEDDRRELVVSGSHSRLRDEKEMDAILQGNGDQEFSPQNAPSYFLEYLAVLYKAKLSFERQPESVTIRVEYS